MTYRQQFTYYEDGYGEVTIVLAVSDSQNGIYAADPIDVDCISLSSQKQDLDISEGVQAEDEIELVISEAHIESQDDEDCLAFILAAQNREDVTKWRFCGLFMLDSSHLTCTVDTLAFSGLIRPKMSATDISWRNNAWSDAPEPCREWKITAAPFFESVLDSVPLKDLIYGNGTPGDSDYALGIDALWESANVKDRLGYWRYDIYHVSHWYRIVNLNALLGKLADNLIATIADRGLGTYTVKFVDSELGVGLSMARFATYLSEWMHELNAITGLYWIDKYERRIPLIGDTVSDEDSLFISYLLTKPHFGQSNSDTDAPSPPGSSPETYSFDRFDTFIDLLYEIARSFAVYLKCVFVGPRELEVSFVSRSSLLSRRCYIKDAIDAEVDTAPIDSEVKQFRGEMCGLASEGKAASHGVNYYVYDTTTRAYSHSPDTIQAMKKSADILLFSLSPTIRRIIHGDPDWIQNVPHNSLAYYNGIVPTTNGLPELYDTKGIATSLYLTNLRSPDAVEQALGERALSPAAAASIIINGKDETFYSLGDYVNALLHRDESFYEAEYTITVPYLHSFRCSPDGSDPDDDGGRGAWKNCRLGCMIVLDTIEYAVIGIERNFEKQETKLRLHYAGRFDFAASSGLSNTVTIPAPTQSSLAKPVVGQVRRHVLGDKVEYGNLVSMMDDQCIYRSIAHNSHYGRYVGIALMAGNAGDAIPVLHDGEFDCDLYVFNVGHTVYVRTTSLGMPNISTSPLDMNNGTEDVFAAIGVAETGSSLLLEFGTQFVFAPPLP